MVLGDFAGLVLVGFAPGFHELVVLFPVGIQAVTVFVLDDEEKIYVAALREPAAINLEIFDLTQFNCDLVRRDLIRIKFS